MVMQMAGSTQLAHNSRQTSSTQHSAPSSQTVVSHAADPPEPKARMPPSTAHGTATKSESPDVSYVDRFASYTDLAAKSPPLHSHRSAPQLLQDSYSQTLENAVFYSQAIQQLRHPDTVAPRTRPGKEDIRQRRARNVTASREVFSLGLDFANVEHPPLPTQQAAVGGREAVSLGGASPRSARPVRPATRHAHARRIATRLLMRAGLSRIAIRVARPGPEPEPEPLCVDDAAEPDELQHLREERRKQVKHIDHYGFMHFDGEPARPASVPGAEGSEAKWQTLLGAFDAATLRGSRKVKRLVQTGVPESVRPRFYYLMTGAAALERAGEYQRLGSLGAQPIFDIIERDISRCYPDHTLFVDGPGQRQLRRVLRAYAQYNPQIGYCQGMGRLVGLFLITGLTEERAFWALAAVVHNYIPRYYMPDLGGLKQHTQVFERLLAERNPRLHRHLVEQGCDALMYATPWFMTVFTLSLPWPTVLRVWDWFAYRGTKVLFRVALAITDIASDHLLAECPTVAELLGFLLHIPPHTVDADVLMQAALRVKVSERHIARLMALG